MTIVGEIAVEPNTDAARLMVISADCHAGATVLGYREYLHSRWHDEFDAWAATYENPFKDLDEVYADRNWDSAKRLRHLEEDGVVAEVIFPNTVPPFFAATGLVASPPSRDDYERRWAGLQAHNRWLADFCADTPGRRAGIAQVLFNEPADAVAELTRLRDLGLTGGMLLPALPPGCGLPPIWDSLYEPIWSACEDLDIPINHHGGSGTPDYGWGPGMPRIAYLTEFTYFSNRVLFHLIWGGIFERHPALRYVITEQGFCGILDALQTHDGVYGVLKGDFDAPQAAAAREIVGDYIDTLPLPPSDYVRRNCWFGASFMSAADVARRHEAGVDHVMWGQDYPHTESTWPHSRERIADAVAGVPVEEARKMVGENAAQFYGFDIDLLKPIADRLGPVATL